MTLRNARITELIVHLVDPLCLVVYLGRRSDAHSWGKAQKSVVRDHPIRIIS